jgi:uncharacterized protein (DUF1778 family)
VGNQHSAIEESMTTAPHRKKPLDRETKQERMELTGADRDAFIAALLAPPEPTKKLVAALKRHQAVFG